MSTLNSPKASRSNSVFNQLVNAIKKALLKVLTRVTKMLYLQPVEIGVHPIPLILVIADSRAF
jgi:hypothetical protein